METELKRRTDTLLTASNKLWTHQRAN